MKKNVLVLSLIVFLCMIQNARAERFLVYPFTANHDGEIDCGFTCHCDTKTGTGHCCGCAGNDYDSTYELVHATMSGTAIVVEGLPDGANANDADGYGNYVKIVSGAWEVIHAHLASDVLVANGAYIKAGDPIGYSSNSGYTSGADDYCSKDGKVDLCSNLSGGALVNDTYFHLHLEVEYNNIDVDPYTYNGGLFIVDSDGSYRFPQEVQSCTTTSTKYPVPLAYVSASGNNFAVSTWWQEDSASALIPYGSVAGHSSGAVKTSFSGKFTSDSYDDILTSYSTNNTRYIVVFSATSDGGFNAAKEWYQGSEDSIDKILVGDKDNNNNISNINNVLLQLCTKK